MQIENKLCDFCRLFEQPKQPTDSAKFVQSCAHKPPRYAAPRCYTGRAAQPCAHIGRTWARFHNNQIGAEGIVSMGNVIEGVVGMLSKPIS